MEYEVNRPDGRATPAAVRDLLDHAVRRLAISSDELWERVAAASTALGRLSREDLPSSTDRRLLDSVRMRVMQLDLANHGALDVGGPAVHATDGALEAIAQDILRLRDRAVLRAFADPPVAS